MKNIILFGIFLAFCCVLDGQQLPCTRANGKRRRCVRIENCKLLNDINRNASRTQEDTELLQSSYCGYIGRTPGVCCPWTSGDPCYSPRGISGSCIGLKSCRHLQKLLLPPLNKTNVDYVERSRCDGVDQYSVCCSPDDDYLPFFEGGNEMKMEMKCNETVSTFPPDPATQCCGVDSSIQNKIYGGNKTTIDQHPWMALVEYEKNDKIKTLCAGALISSKYVLTAGFCVQGPLVDIGTPKSIRLGEYNTDKEGPDCVPVESGGEDCTDGAIRIPIEKTIPHPEFNPLLRNNDIALIRMVEDAPFTDFIRPICLPRTNVIKKTPPFTLSLAGWGSTETGARSLIKLHVELPFVSLEKCQQAFQNNLQASITKSHICAGEKGKDACKGDIGGPLMNENGGIYEVVGIVSFGPTPCGRKDIPGVYTNVFVYNPWIRSNMVI